MKSIPLNATATSESIADNARQICVAWWQVRFSGIGVTQTNELLTNIGRIVHSPIGSLDNPESEDAE